MRTDRVVVCGDVNGSSPWWGCSAEDSRGRDVAEALASLGLEVLNRGGEPTYHALRQGRECTSLIDVTACSAALLPAAAAWRVDPAFGALSDHRAIRFELRLGARRTSAPDPAPATTRIYDPKKANWTMFGIEFERELGRLDLERCVADVADAEGVERVAERYTESVAVACERAVPHVSPGGIRRACRWWTPELSRRVMKACSTRVGDRLLEAADGTALEPLESAVLLADTFYPRDDPAQDTAGQARLRALVRDLVAGLRARPSERAAERAAFTPTELETVLRAMSPKKAPGGDGLTLDICLRAFADWASVGVG